MRKIHKSAKNRRQNRVRGSIQGTSVRPRITVFRSNKYTYVQAIDDVEGKTLLSGSTSSASKSGTKSEQSLKLGESFGKQLSELKVESCVFDRGSYKYHGRVKNVAEGIRKAGLKF